ncbi:MAG: hypothetical protein M1825_005319 [Sarcosagium campestre]|nr:MAG: hypothetical protein M1825_005319 [Sarcosagium campestre]
MQVERSRFSPSTPETSSHADWDYLRSGRPTPLELPSPNSKAKQRALLHEPSPASTYGETAIGDSMPGTPQGADALDPPLLAFSNDHAPTKNAVGIVLIDLDLERSCALGSTLAAAVLNSFRDRLLGSSAPGRRSVKSMNLTPVLRDGNHAHGSPKINVSTDLPFASDRYGRPAEKYNLTRLPSSTPRPYESISYDDVPSSAHDQGSAIHLRSAAASSAVSSPGRNGHSHQHGDDPLFILHGRDDDHANDPFTLPRRPVVHIREPSTPNGNVSRNQGTESDSSPHTLVSSSDPTGSFVTMAKPEVHSPRADRAGEPISAENAQAVLPPSACVFVANLASVRTDEQLETSVKQIFEEFGVVYVKIRRDTRGMPYAFCQYERDEDARSAILGGRRRLIDGRPCRTEPAKVNRSLYLSKLTGGPIAKEEAERVLEVFGQIDRLWWSSPTEREMYQLPDGVWVKYAYFQDCRDAQSAFRDHSFYRLEQPMTAADRAAPTRQSPVTRPSWNNRVSLKLEPQSVPSLPFAAARQDSDRCSVFIGNLPETMTRERLIQVFSNYGNIASVDFVAKPSAHRAGLNVFAFMDFSSREEAARAIEGHNQQILDGSRIRVEAKDSAAQGPRRLLTTQLAPVTFGNELRPNVGPAPRGGLAHEIQRLSIAQAHMPSSFDPSHGQAMRHDVMYQPGAQYSSSLPEYSAITYSSVGAAAAHAAREVARVSAALAQMAAQDEGANQGGTPFPQAAYAQSGYYGQMPGHGVSAASASAPTGDTGPQVYQPYQQYQQSMVPYQYSPYYPYSYYQQYSQGPQQAQTNQYLTPMNMHGQDPDHALLPGPNGDVMREHASEMPDEH